MCIANPPLQAPMLNEVYANGGPTFQGLLCYAADEAAWLAESGFDDLLIAYPTVQRAGLDAVAAAVPSP